jgi:serine/threonine-protein kinase PknG
MASCAQPGCSGTIEDGYCNACGMAAAHAAAAPAAPPAGHPATASARTGSARTPSTRSARSTRSTRSGSTRSTRSSSRGIGGGRPLARPPLAPQDPLASLVPGAVPERKRRCSNCDAPLKREEGFCATCGQNYSFKATLAAGDRVADKYEIKGTVAFGGLGWIYLALDTVLNRWVILKGLLNSKDAHMLEVAVQEREYLAAVKHPNIVGIYDFVTHGTEGFIVMEYVNGKTLMALRKEHGGPLPPAEAISYILEILPAFQYLSDGGLVYCDFKPENVMVEEETVKLIDLGAVRREDDTGGDIYGSKGYTAPEAREAPTASSDLYSVARALAVLVASFDFQGAHEYELPPQKEHEAFTRHESLYRFLVKATRKDPGERFQTATEMADQLLGVLREVLGGAGDLGHVESVLFDRDSDREVESGDERTPTGLPHLRVDRDDPAADIIIAAGAVLEPTRRKAMFERALKTHPASLELQLRLVDEMVRLGDFAGAENRLAEVAKRSPGDWRFAWYRGRALLAQGRTQETLATFQSIVDELPGELAPKHALGRAYEASGLLERAIHYYDAVSRADAGFTSAALALARCLERKNDKAGAAEAYRRVPATSSRYAGAQMALARALVSADPAPTWKDVIDAGDAMVSIDGAADGIAYHELRAVVYAAGAVLAEGRAPSAPHALMAVGARPRLLRAGAEAELRTCARYAKTDAARWAYVDRANAVRPMTWT